MVKVTGPTGFMPPGEAQGVEALNRLIDEYLTISRQEKTGRKEPTGPSLSSGPRLSAPEIDVSSAGELLAELKGKITDDMVKVAKTAIEKKRDEQQDLSKKRIDELQKSVEALNQSQVWGTLAKVLGWLVPAVMFVVGAVMCATGVGAGAGVSLMVGGAMGLAMQVLQETGATEWLTNKIAEGLEQLGVGKEAAKWIAFGIVAVSMAAIMIASSLGVGAIAAKANLIAQGTSAGAKIAVALTQAGAQVSQAGVGAGKGITEGISLLHRSEAEKIEAFLKRVQQQLMEQEDMLREALESWQQGMQIVMGVVDAQNTAAKVALQV